MDYLKRRITHKLMQVAKLYPVVLISGPRQAGKTTLARNCFPNHEWILLDSHALLERARKDPGLFFSTHKPPMILDEVQRAPELLQEIKYLVDSYALPPASIILTGSQPLQLMKNASESLAGRVGIIELSSMTQSELQQSLELPLSLEEFVDNPPLGKKFSSNVSVMELLFRGGLPPMAIEKMSPNSEEVVQRFSDYISTYLTRDLRELANVHDLGRFEKFLRISATASSRIANINDLAAQIGVPQSTTQEWLGLLRASNLILELPAYHSNQIKRETRRPKSVLFDSGLMCNLLGYQNYKQIELSPLLGAIFETSALNYVYTYVKCQSGRFALYHWRHKEQEEIDALIELNNNSLLPIEIKFTTRPKAEDLKGLVSFMKKYPQAKKGVLISRSDECFLLSESIIHLPWSAL